VLSLLAHASPVRRHVGIREHNARKDSVRRHLGRVDDAVRAQTRHLGSRQDLAGPRPSSDDDVSHTLDRARLAGIAIEVLHRMDARTGVRRLDGCDLRPLADLGTPLFRQGGDGCCEV
jgi:hypothetical protein